MADDDVMIRVKEDRWSELNSLKKPGESFDDVITRLLDETRGECSGNRNGAVATV
jgi:predicted CopG family antitoxin